MPPYHDDEPYRGPYDDEEPTPPRRRSPKKTRSPSGPARSPVRSPSSFEDGPRDARGSPGRRERPERRSEDREDDLARAARRANVLLRDIARIRRTNARGPARLLRRGSRTLPRRASHASLVAASSLNCLDARRGSAHTFG